MNIAIILNGISRRKPFFYSRILPVLQSEFSITVFETKSAGHAMELAGRATGRFHVILAAGGDGTLNQVLNGILTGPAATLPTLGLIPLGSGNDFADTAGLTARPELLLALLKQNKPQPTDVGFISCVDSANAEKHHYFINVCSMGMGPATVKQMENAPAWLGANGRYLVSILQTFFTHKPESVALTTDNWHWRGSARVLAVANGRSFGHKIYVAPDAAVHDGLFNLFVAAHVPLFKFVLYLQKLKRAQKVVGSRIHYARAEALSVTSDQQVALEAEGELVGFLPATIRIKPGLVSFLR